MGLDWQFRQLFVVVVVVVPIHQFFAFVSWRQSRVRHSGG
jgi:hypothetical protein